MNGDMLSRERHKMKVGHIDVNPPLFVQNYLKLIEYEDINRPRNLESFALVGYDGH